MLFLSTFGNILKYFHVFSVFQTFSRITESDNLSCQQKENSFHLRSTLCKSQQEKKYSQRVLMRETDGMRFFCFGFPNKLFLLHVRSFAGLWFWNSTRDSKNVEPLFVLEKQLFSWFPFKDMPCWRFTIAGLSKPALCFSRAKHQFLQWPFNRSRNEKLRLRLYLQLTYPF